MGSFLPRNRARATTPPDKERFFAITSFAGTFTDKKSWDSHQPRLGIAPLARFRGPIARFGGARKFTSAERDFFWFHSTPPRT